MVKVTKLAALILLSGSAASLATGETSVKGDIVIGRTCDMSGPMSDFSRRTHAGMRACFDQINQQGGINGHRIVLRLRNDHGQPENAARQAQQLIDDFNSVMIVGAVGADTAADVAQVCRQKNIAFVSPFSGSPAFSDREDEAVFALLPDYSAEAEKIINSAGIGNTQDLACFVEKSAEGEEMLRAMHSALREHGMSLAGSASVDKSDPDISSAVKRLSHAHPDVIVINTSASTAAAFIKEWQNRFGNETRFIASSNLPADILADSLGQSSSEVFVMQPFAEMWSDEKITAEFRDAMKAAGEDDLIGPASFEGFAAGKLICQALRSCGNDFTSSTITGALKNGAAVNFGNTTLSFSSGGNIPELQIARLESFTGNSAVASVPE